MKLREAAQQVAQQATPREQLLKELMDSRVPKTEREHAAAREIERLRAALAEDAKDWSELESLRESLREHMTEIHRLREAGRQALDAFDSMYGRKPERVEKVITTLRATLSWDAMQRLTDVQQEMEATSQEFRQVEPVAYVTGYSKGYATVQPVDPCLLMPVGMALYRSPPKSAHDKVYSEVDLADAYQKGWDDAMLRRAIERAHGIGGEE